MTRDFRLGDWPVHGLERLASPSVPAVGTVEASTGMDGTLPGRRRRVAVCCGRAPPPRRPTRAAAAVEPAGGLRWSQGRWSETIAYLEESSALAAQTGQPLLVEFNGTILARVRSARGDFGAARAPVDRALATADAAGVPPLRRVRPGPVVVAIGFVRGGPDPAVLGGAAGSPQRWVGGGPPIRGACFAVFESLGARAWSTLARRQLDTLGVHAGPSDVPALSRLTAKELQVATAVARGSSNREAAALLFISPKTVEFEPRPGVRQARGVDPHPAGQPVPPRRLSRAPALGWQSRHHPGSAGSAASLRGPSRTGTT